MGVFNTDKLAGIIINRLSWNLWAYIVTTLPTSFGSANASSSTAELKVAVVTITATVTTPPPRHGPLLIGVTYSTRVNVHVPRSTVPEGRSTSNGSRWAVGAARMQLVQPQQRRQPKGVNFIFH